MKCACLNCIESAKDDLCERCRFEGCEPGSDVPNDHRRATDKPFWVEAGYQREYWKEA